MSILDVLPPSPPSTSSRRKLMFPKSSMNGITTPGSPASFPGSSNGTRKRVEFSPWTNTHQPVHSSQPSADSPAMKALPTSSACPSSLKSILKPSPAHEKGPHTTDEQQEVDPSISEMMESILQQLTNDERTVSVDAYQTLSRVIRQYDDVPEEAILKTKVTTILRFIKRDLLRPIEEIADTNLITQALKVLVIFVWNPDYSSVFTDEYRLFILDRSILVLSEHTAPKSVIMHYLHLLATQSFRWNLIISNNRITRLLEALKALTDHIRGNGVLSERLLVYRKLLDQTKATMKSKASLWVEELLTGMTSNMKEVRTRAIDLGVQACAAFPASSPISSIVRNILERELEKDFSFGTAMSRRLEKMIVSKEEMAQVPQIWAIVVLLSNSVDTRIDDWAGLKEWLKVIQRCFNCSEPSVRQQSNLAWNRLVSVVRPHEASETLLSMLSKPITAQLERQSTDKAVKASRATAVGSYCNLLYYAFRAAANHKQYTRVWNEYIVKVMRSTFFEKNSANSDIACRILIALLWNSSKGTKVWNENRALQDSRSVEPEEIPTLDCKWIRAKSSAIVDMFRVLLRYSSWGASGQSDKAYIAIAWTHFLKALREASSKEIKQSTETRHAITTVTSFLENLWQEASHHAVDLDAHTMAQIRQMTRSAIAELGYSIVLMTPETNKSSTRPPLIFSEALTCIVSEMRQQTSTTDIRSYPVGHKSPLESFMPQYEKCLELLGTTVVQEYQPEGNFLSLIEVTKTFSNLLLDVPIELLLSTIKRLSAILILLLRDDQGILKQHCEMQHDLTHETFRINIIDALMKMPHTNIVLLDDVFSAIFGSQSTVAVNHAVKLWNTTFAQEDDTIIGPGLTEGLLKLQSQRDIKIPGMPQVTNRQESPRISSPLVYEETPSPSRPRSDYLHLAEVNKFGIPSPILGSQACVSAFADENETDEEILSSPVKFQPRSRHDDSQIHFVPIASSPRSEQQLESQSLTTHQKDVRDRQRSEPAVVFPDLRSSPRPQSKSQTYGDCEFARKAASLQERPSTPILPTNQEQRDLEIMASPTPRARHFATRITDIEVPSSPPSMHDHQDKEAPALDHLSSPPQGPVDDAQMHIEIGIPRCDGLDQSDGEADQYVETPPRVQGFLVDDGEAYNEPIDQIDHAAEANKHQTDAVMQGTGIETNQFATVSEREFDAALERTNNEASRCAEQRTDSDEIDMLSASQLSQDLDRHLSQSMDSTIDRTDMDSLLVVLPENAEGQARASPRIYNTRKRKATTAAKPAKKRRTKSASQLSSASVEDDESSSQFGSQQDMLDTIEVISSPVVSATANIGSTPAPQATTTEPARSPRPTRGRRRKNRRNNQSQESRRTSQIVEAVVIPLAPGLKIEENENATSTNLNDTLEEDVDLEPVGGEEETPNTQAEDNTEQEADTTVLDEMGAPPMMIQQENVGRAPPAFLSSLEIALNCIQSETADNIDLRAVDELCFQIRFHAQLRAQQSRS